MVRGCNRGFTLLELLVVVLIIGLISSFAALSVGTREERLRHHGERLLALVRLAGEEAIMNATDLALRLHRHGYEFAVLAPDGRLLPLEDEEGSLRARRLPEGLWFSAVVDGLEVALGEGEDGEEGAAVIFLLSSGEMTPFQVSLHTESGEIYRLQGDIDGTVREGGREQRT